MNTVISLDSKIFEYSWVFLVPFIHFYLFIYFGLGPTPGRTQALLRTLCSRITCGGALGSQILYGGLKWVGCMQGQGPSHCTISLALWFLHLEKSVGQQTKNLVPYS